MVTQSNIVTQGNIGTTSYTVLLYQLTTTHPSREPYQTANAVYFILGILRTDLWSQGTSAGEITFKQVYDNNVQNHILWYIFLKLNKKIKVLSYKLFLS